MKLQFFAFAFVALTMTILSCSNESDQMNTEADITLIDKTLKNNGFQKGFDFGPRPRSGSCVGVIESVRWVRPGEEDTYREGEIICVECGVRQLDCQDAYRLRIWRDGLRMAEVFVVSEDRFCTQCPKEGLVVN